MEESRTQVIMVTEAIFASSLDLLTKFSNVPGHRHQVKLSELDVKAGLLQVRRSTFFDNVNSPAYPIQMI